MPGRYPDQVIAALVGAVNRCPDQRVMQVIVNALGEDPFYIEDADAVLRLQEYPPASATEPRGSSA